MEQKNNDVRERVIEVVRTVWGNNYRAIEDETGVPAPKWKRMCNRLQQPTIEMIEGIAKIRPYFLMWMITGSADTYMQLSPHDKWQQKLARALGADPENEPDRWQSKIARVLGSQKS